jgi:hypothetical protein
MARTRARFTHDEVVRLIKGVQSAGLPIARVSFDGNVVEVVVGDAEQPDKAEKGLLREPQL